jgi:DnaJ-class molecular chaperone
MSTWTWIPGRPYRCPVCNGRGTMPADFYAALGTVASTNPVQCKSCKGTGVVWDDRNSSGASR